MKKTRFLELRLQGAADPTDSRHWKSSPSPPPAPDYVGAANATAQGNKEAVLTQSAANRVNQVTPYGNLNYAVTGHDEFGNPTWTATQTLSPDQQSILNKNMTLSKGLLDSANTGLNYANDVISHPGVNTSTLPQLPINPGESYTDAYSRWMQPNWDRQQAALDNQLANQGVTRGSEAYTNAQRDLHDQQARDQLQAVTTGMGVGLNANQQGFQQAAYNQMQPINVINALRTGNQVQTPNYTPVPQQGYAPGPDIMGATNGMYQGQLNNYNAGVASANSANNGLFSLGGAILAAPMTGGGSLAGYAAGRMFGM